MAASAELAWKTLPELAKAVTIFLDPVLASVGCGTWQPDAWAWSGWRLPSSELRRGSMPGR
jgi:hypothetical protein